MNPTETAGPLCGIVHRLFYTSPTFSAGLVKAEDGRCHRFRGGFCTTEGDRVTLVGTWVDDPKYGRQFDAERLSYELPDTPEGLARYLATDSAFKGIGPKMAERLVAEAGDGETLDRLLREDLEGLRARLRIPRKALETLRDEWIAHADENRVRTYLASFGLTPYQMDVLLDRFGHGVVGVLRADPYQLIQYLDGYGFKRVDKIARRMGVPKDHPGRIEAAVRYCLSEAIGHGHTWTDGAILVEQAHDVLVLDTLDGLDQVRAGADRLLARGEIVCDGRAVTMPAIHEAERLIHDTFRTHAWRTVTFPPGTVHPDGLNPGQREAYRTALSRGIAVVSGGAGVGKTYLVARLAKTLQAAGRTVALCAPTGKAAKRIEEVMRAYGLALEAKTVHRLLGYDGYTFHRESLSEPWQRESGETDPACDVVICDEVSMVDVPLLAELFRRIDFARTRLVLVGDHNQLPPVGPGNVLRDVIHHDLAPTTVLTEVVRQAGVLKANATAVLSGTVAPTEPNEAAWVVIDAFRDAGHIQTYLRDLVLERIPERLGYDPVRDVQLITPTHKGPLGTRALSAMMQRLLHGEVEGRFTVGDKVIQTSNDYDLGVMNGTIGHVLAIEKGVCTIDFNGEGIKQVDGQKTANVQLAYALTAHKAQGSEFPCAVVLCHKSHFFADRNWLYTAVTRAAKSCILVGDRWGLRNAAKKNRVIQRRTLLGLWAKREGDPQP